MSVYLGYDACKNIVNRHMHCDRCVHVAVRNRSLVIMNVEPVRWANLIRA